MPQASWGPPRPVDPRVGLLSFSDLPLRLWTGVGAVVSLAAIVYGLFVLVATLVGADARRRTTRTGGPLSGGELGRRRGVLRAAGPGSTRNWRGLACASETDALSSASAAAANMACKPQRRQPSVR